MVETKPNRKTEPKSGKPTRTETENSEFCKIPNRTETEIQKPNRTENRKIPNRARSTTYWDQMRPIFDLIVMGL